MYLFAKTWFEGLSRYINPSSGVVAQVVYAKVNGAVTQLVECQTENLVVGSSNLPRSTMSSLISKFSDFEFSNLVKESESISDIATKLGYRSKGGGVTKLIKDRIKELNIDISHFNRYAKGNLTEKNKPLEDILVQNSTYTNNTSLKKRLLKAQLIEYRCYICGISEWNNQPLSLQLDHINGNNKDNRIENLRLLCPNCHSQTDTFSGRNASHN